MDSAWIARKLSVVRGAWKKRYGVEPSSASAAVVLAVATHETLAGDAWPGENNWGAVQRGDGKLTTEERSKLAAAGIVPQSPRTKVGAKAIEDARALLRRPNAALHADSSPINGWYYVYFWAFETEEEGASYFLSVLIDRAGVRPAIDMGDPQAVAEAMYRSHYFEGVHDPRPKEGELQASGWPMKGQLTKGQQANVDDYAKALRALYGEFIGVKKTEDNVIDLSFRKLVPGESKSERLVRIARYIASLTDAQSRALLEPGAQTAAWTCMVFCRACIWHSCLTPEDELGKVVIINGHTFGRYGDDEDRTIIGSLMMLSKKFVDARPPHGADLVLEEGAIFWQSAPAGGNDHVGIVRAWRERADGAVDLDTSEGGQTPVNAKNFMRTWRKRSDGRWDNAGPSGSPAPGSSIIQGLAYCEWPILTAPAVELPPEEIPTNPEGKAVTPEPDPSNVSRETLDPTIPAPDPTITKKRLDAVQMLMLVVFGAGSAIIGWLLNHC